MHQLDLCEPDPRTLARSGDPATSHLAAQRTTEFAPAHRERILAALRRFGRAGAEQLGAATRLEPYSVRKRLAELKGQGLAEPTGDERTTITGRTERVWRALP